MKNNGLQSHNTFQNNSKYSEISFKRYLEISIDKDIHHINIKISSKDPKNPSKIPRYLKRSQDIHQRSQDIHQRSQFLPAIPRYPRKSQDIPRNYLLKIHEVLIFLMNRPQQPARRGRVPLLLGKLPPRLVSSVKMTFYHVKTRVIILRGHLFLEVIISLVPGLCVEKNKHENEAKKQQRRNCPSSVVRVDCSLFWSQTMLDFL